MAEITIDAETLTKALTNASRGVLPWTLLYVRDFMLDEQYLNPPPINELPQVMLTPAFVPSENYLWKYDEARLVILEYVLKRGTSWNTGRIRIFHTMPFEENLNLDEGFLQPSPEAFTPHSLYVSNTVDLAIGDCGVSLSVAQDGNTRFGITFQITDATSTEFPYMAATYTSVIPVG